MEKSQITKFTLLSGARKVIFFRSGYSFPNYLTKKNFLDASGKMFQVVTFLQQLLFPQQLVKMFATLAASEGDGDGGFEAEDGANLLGAPLNGRSISTNSRS